MIKKFINPLYLLSVLMGSFLYMFVSDMNEQTLLFYGFTENKETEINLDHTVEVNRIFVTVGDKVLKGDTLLEVSNVKFEHDIQQTLDRIEELKIKEEIWNVELKGELKILESERKQSIADLESTILQLKSKKDFEETLHEGLENVNQQSSDYDPLSEKIMALQNEKELLKHTLDTEIIAQEKKLEIGKNPFRQQINSLNAEITLNKSKINKLSIVAPEDGLIGSILCKEAEHIAAFTTLMTFYEPQPNLVKGYVHENQIVHVELNDSLVVKAFKNSELKCKGVVTGLGSRIVEIPPRLRKMADFKTYGREILIKIPYSNDYLQKEKVILFLTEEKEEINENIAFKETENQEAIVKKVNNKPVNEIITHTIETTNN